MRPITGTAEIDDLEAFLDALDEIAAETDCTVQAFDARYVTGPAHLRQAVRLADRAFERGENVARDRGVEWLVYAAARRQIDDALTMGVSAGTTPAVVCVAANDPDATGFDAPDDVTSLDGSDDVVDETTADSRESADPSRERAPDDRERVAAERVAELLRDARRAHDGWDATDPERVRSFFDVTDRELTATDGTLADVVRERVALLDVEK